MDMMQTRPRILLVDATSAFGGGEVYYIKLARLLSEKYELAAVAFNPRLQAEFEDMGMPVWAGTMPDGCTIWRKYLTVARCTLKAIRQFHPALVHLNGGLEGYLAFIPRLFGIPVLLTNHIVRTNAPAAFLKRLALWISAELAQKVICVSETVQNNLRQHAWTTNTIVIYNWLDLVPDRTNRRRYDGTSEFRLLFVGRIEAAKGIMDLIKAIELLQNVRLDIVGEGPDMARARNGCVGMPVHFHGFQENVTTYYMDADMLVFPSYSEGQPLVLIEAMSCGLPCLASDIAAAIETTNHGRFAELFRCGDPSDMADKIRGLQNNRQRLVDLSERGRSYALETYSEEHIRPMYFDLIRSIIGP